MKCPKCGQKVEAGSMFCEYCGTPLKVEAAPVRPELHCPACGTVVEEGTVFCPACGQRITPPQEAPPVEQSPYEVPSEQPLEYPLRESEPQLSFFDRYKKVIIGAVIAVLLIGGGVFGGKFYMESQYVKHCTAVSERLDKDNKSLVSHAQSLSKAGSDEERSKAIEDMKADKDDLDALIKENNDLSAPAKYEETKVGINALLAQHQTLYADALFVAENPAADDAAKKLDEMDKMSKILLKFTGSSVVPGVDFSAVAKIDPAVNYLKLFMDSAMNKKKSDQGKQTLTAYIMSKDTYNQEITALSDDINAYLGEHSNFIGSTGLDSRASQIYSDIYNKKSQLNKENISNTALKSKLLEVYDAEMGRVGGLRDGIRDSQNGRDYLPAFRRGTAAAYKFDDVNAEFSKLLEMDNA